MKIKRKVFAGLVLPMLMFVQLSFASKSFTTCPSQACLIQGSSSVKLYSVDLDFKVLNAFNRSGLNGFAYNFHDDYLYVDDETIDCLDPLSDDDHDDGIAFLAGSNVGQTSLLQVSSSGAGYINVWIELIGTNT